MTEPVFRIDEAAVLKGGEIGGEYLDAIGKTDLGDLNKAQWTIFLTKVIGGAFMSAKIADVLGGKPPF